MCRHNYAAGLLPKEAPEWGYEQKGLNTNPSVISLCRPHFRLRVRGLCTGLISDSGCRVSLLTGLCLPVPGGFRAICLRLVTQLRIGWEYNSFSLYSLLSHHKSPPVAVL